MRGLRKATVVVGLTWGDEGKGKIIDVITESAQLVARYQGGNNAGHTIVVKGKKVVVHLLPSGVFYPKVQCVIGNGVVVDPAWLLKEMNEMDRLGLGVRRRLVVSDRAHVVFPYHRLLDEAREHRREGSIGTTHRGIGPAYTDKAARVGIVMGDLLDRVLLERKLRANVEEKNFLLTHYYRMRRTVSLRALLRQGLEWGRRLAPYIGDAARVVDEAILGGKRVVLEGAQGVLLDMDFGTYPYVTSSNPVAAGACLGVGISPTRIGRCVGLVKAYTTRVGVGPFPTELHNAQGEVLRARGQEYGATTGRTRRCGWFDAVAARYGVRVCGADSFVVTKLDVLDGIDPIRIAVAYTWHGERREEFPSNVRVLEGCVPVYEELPGWHSSTAGVRRMKDLPMNAKRYLRRLETLLGIPIEMVSTGAERHQIIVVGGARSSRRR